MKMRQSSREAWQERIKGWEASELTQVEYCKREGLSVVKFRYWRGRLQKLVGRVQDGFSEIPIPAQMETEPLFEMRLDGDGRIEFKLNWKLEMRLFQVGGRNV
jgi:hypothetical protein